MKRSTRAAHAVVTLDRTSMASRMVCFLVALAAVFVDARPRAAATPCEFDNVDRIVAVGDVHGAYDRFVEILRVAGIVDRNGRWSGGRTHLVQLGDVLDRGSDSRKALDLLARLEREASSAGGRVHSLIGNHEAMRMLGNYQYVTPGEYAAFATRESDELRKTFVESAAPADRERLLGEMPLGMIEMIRAFGPQGQYGERLRTLNAVVKINGILFLHGGISPTTASLSCTAINDTVRRELSADLEKTRAAPLTSMVGREDGPLWYRGLALEPDSFASEIDGILAAQQARALVVAHTPTHQVTVRFAGKVFLIDTGMQAGYVPDGRASALEIRGGVFTAIYRDSRGVVAGGLLSSARGAPPPLAHALRATPFGLAAAAAPSADGPPSPSALRRSAPAAQRSGAGPRPH